MKNKLIKVLSPILLMLLISPYGISQTYEWGGKIGGGAYDSGKSLTVDGSGNVYTTGTFQSGTIDCDPGSGVYNLTFSGAGFYNIFITKLDVSGNFVWAKGIGSTAGLGVSSIKVDASGNSYILGQFDGTVDFDPGASVYDLTTTGTLSETFILKLNTSGDFVWAKKITNSNTSSYSIGMDLEVDASGNIYYTGTLNGTADFNPGAGVSNLTATSGFSSDIYISKLDASGSFLWANVIGNSGSDESNAIAIDASGNLYITGFYQNTVDFDPSAGISNLVSAGFYDIFIAKYNTSGNFIWAQSIGGSDTDKGSDLKIDASGNVYSTGTFKGTVDFDPGAGTFNVTAIGYEDMYVLKLNSAGNLLWIKAFSGASNSISRCLDLDGSGNVYVGGQFMGTFDFDPSAATNNLISAGDYDAFISKLDASGNFVWAKSFGALDSDLVWDLKVAVGGNVLACGGFGGTVDLNPTSSVQNITSSGENDAFVLKWAQCSIVTPTITIAASPGTTITAGTNITFTATISNGGSTPAYQWKLNGNDVGGNTSTYSNSTLANGDVITCTLTSNAPCASTNTVGSNTLTIAVTGSGLSNDEPCGAVPLAVNTTCTYSIFTNAGATNSVGIPAHSCQAITNNDVWFSFVAPASGQTIIKTVASGMTDGVMSIYSGTCTSLTEISCNDDVNPSNYMPLISSSGLIPGNTYFIRVSSFQTTFGLFDICITDPNPVAAPSITISASPSGSICVGNQVVFSAIVSNAGGSPAYQWKKNGTNVGTGLSTFTTNTLANGDVITCAVTVSGNTAMSNSIVMTVSSPVVNITLSGQILSATPGFNSYQWSLNGNTINGATTSDYNAGSVTGNYAVAVGDLNGCVATASYNYGTTGISTISNSNFNLYPNPSNGNVTISFTSADARTVKVLDLTGKIVYSTSSNQEELNMNLGHLLPSIYNVIITNENGVRNFERVMILK